MQVKNKWACVHVANRIKSHFKVFRNFCLAQMRCVCFHCGSLHDSHHSSRRREQLVAHKCWQFWFLFVHAFFGQFGLPWSTLVFVSICYDMDSALSASIRDFFVLESSFWTFFDRHTDPAFFRRISVKFQCGFQTRSVFFSFQHQLEKRHLCVHLCPETRGFLQGAVSGEMDVKFWSHCLLQKKPEKEQPEKANWKFSPFSPSTLLQLSVTSAWSWFVKHLMFSMRSVKMNHDGMQSRPSRHFQVLNFERWQCRQPEISCQYVTVVSNHPSFSFIP